MKTKKCELFVDGTFYVQAMNAQSDERLAQFLRGFDRNNRIPKKFLGKCIDGEKREFWKIHGKFMIRVAAMSGIIAIFFKETKEGLVPFKPGDFLTLAEYPSFDSWEARQALMCHSFISVMFCPTWIEKLDHENFLRVFGYVMNVYTRNISGLLDQEFKRISNKFLCPRSGRQRHRSNKKS